MYRIATVTVDAAAMAAMPADARDNHVMSLVHQALTGRPDVVLLPELCWCYGTDWQRWHEHAEKRDGPRVQAFSALARKHNCYFALPLLESRDDGLFNTLLLIDRAGRAVWHYDKLFLTDAERQLGLKAGQRPIAFDADFARLGAVICFDLNFMELAEHWRDQKIGLLLFPSMFRGGALLAQWSMTTQAYVAAAAADEGSRIVTPMGTLLAMSSQYAPVVTRPLPRQFVVCHIDRNYEAWPAIRKRYGERIELDIQSAEGRFVLNVLDPALKASDIVREFSLEPLTDYLIRSRAANAISVKRLLADNAG